MLKRRNYAKKNFFNIYFIDSYFLLCGCSKTENKNKNLNTYKNTCDPTILDKNSLNIEIFIYKAFIFI